MKNRNMTYGNPAVLILSFSIPLMLGNIFQQLYILVDTLIVGKMTGINGLAAIGAVEWTIFLVTGGIQGITHGFSINMAQSFGDNKVEELTDYIVCSLKLSAVFSILLLALGQLLAAPVLEIMHVPVEINAMAKLYLRIIYLGIPITFFFHLFSAILRAIGNSQIPLTAMVISSIINVFLDIVAVVILKTGVGGAALATVFSQLVATVFCIIYLRKNIPDIFKMNRNRYMNGKMFFKQLSIALPMGVQNIITAVGGVIVQSVVNSFGVAFIAGYTAANKLYGLLEIPASSYGYTLSTYAGQNMGRKEIRRVNEGLTTGCIIGVITAELMSFIMLCGGRNILTCFLPENTALTESAIEIGGNFLKILSIFFWLLYVLYILRGCVQGMGNSVVPMLSSIFQLVMRVFCAIYLSKLTGRTAVFWGEIAAWTGAFVFLLLFYLHEYKKLIKQSISKGMPAAAGRRGLL